MEIRSGTWLAAVVAAVAVLVAAGCSGGDGGDEAGSGGARDRGRGGGEAGEAGGAGGGDEAGTGTTAAADADLSAYCEAALAMETPAAPDVDYASATPEQEAEANRTHARETLRPLADAVVATAPDELAADAERLRAAVDELATSGDFAAFRGPDVEDARANLHAFDRENCDWHVQELTTRDYSYEGVPEELPAGPTSFELANEGDEVHELVLVRKNDGVTASAEELLAMPQDESQGKVTEIGYAFAPVGEEDYVVVDLEPGDYVGVCFVVSGTTDPENPSQEGPPHSARGMAMEFTVPAG